MENGKKFKFLVIASVVAFLFSGKIEAKISDSQFIEMSSSLNIGADTVLSKYLENEIKAVLNKFIGEKEESEITYGVLIMGVFDEMEFMDAILSQKFLERNRAYFNSVLDKRINLFKHWGKTGKSFLSVLKKGKSATPLTALALESVEIIDKTMAIFEAWKVLENTERYKGLWVYFDWRKQGNEPHKVAWDGAIAEMGGMANSLQGFYKENKRQKEIDLLEQQFAALYEKWGPYATPNGISKEYKKKLAGELRNTLASALEEERSLAKEELEPSLSLFDKFVAQLEKIKSVLDSLADKVNPFSAGPVLELVENPEIEAITEETVEVRLPQPEIMGVGDPLNSSPVPEPEKPAEHTEEIPLYETEGLAQEVIFEPGLMEGVETAPNLEPEQASEITRENNEVEFPQAEEASQVEPTQQEVIGVGNQSLCQKVAGDLPRRYRVFINEVAWMGSQDSSNDEWIELKNIFGMPLNLQGWQVQDKDQQIKKIFGENDIIPTNGYFLLERSKDYTGALNNTDEALYLFDNNCQLEDEVLANPNWPAGDNIGKKTMQRFDAMSWYSQIATPNEANSSPPASLQNPSGPAAPTPAPSAQAPETPSFSVLINEIAWAGTKANSADEWIVVIN